MSAREIAKLILAAVGGTANIRACGICATRLRILVYDITKVDREELGRIYGVLGVVWKGSYGLEVVLGPRLVTDVSEGLSALTGIRSSLEELTQFDTADAPQSLTIQLSETSAGKAANPPQQIEEEPESSSEDDTKEEIGEMLLSIDDDEDDEDDEIADDILPRSLLVINGPNINMLGIRETEIYGTETFERLIEVCKEAAKEAGFDSCECLQSNHEGDLVTYIQQALGVHDAIVINPGAYTHTSIALLDALKAVRIPAVEVHISAVDEREDFRKMSYVRLACIATISGHGIEGYREAIQLLADHLDI